MTVQRSRGFAHRRLRPLPRCGTLNLGTHPSKSNRSLRGGQRQQGPPRLARRRRHLHDRGCRQAWLALCGPPSPTRSHDTSRWPLRGSGSSPSEAAPRVRDAIPEPGSRSPSRRRRCRRSSRRRSSAIRSTNSMMGQAVTCSPSASATRPPHVRAFQTQICKTSFPTSRRCPKPFPSRDIAPQSIHTRLVVEHLSQGGALEISALPSIFPAFAGQDTSKRCRRSVESVLYGVSILALIVGLKGPAQGLRLMAAWSI